MISLDNISFSYQKNGRKAIDSITCGLEPGIYLLAGENGAGKTTLLHLIAGVLSPQSGNCTIDGRASSSDLPSDKRRIFLLEENIQFPGKSINEFASRHSVFYPNFSQETFISNLRAFGMTGEEPLKTLSLGNRKKAQLAYALALGVEILMLDEPMNALDIQSRAILRNLIGTTPVKDQTIIVATHTISDLETVFDGCIMISRSKLLYAGSAEEITRRLAFRVNRMPDPDALYSEIQIGRTLGIFKSEKDEDTAIDWRILYNALHSPSRGKVIESLNN